MRATTRKNVERKAAELRELRNRVRHAIVSWDAWLYANNVSVRRAADLLADAIGDERVRRMNLGAIRPFDRPLLWLSNTGGRYRRRVVPVSAVTNFTSPEWERMIGWARRNIDWLNASIDNRDPVRVAARMRTDRVSVASVYGAVEAMRSVGVVPGPYSPDRPPPLPDATHSP